MELKIEIDYSKVRRRLAGLFSPKKMLELNKHVGGVVLERVKDYLDEMSTTRHKTADRLGAVYSRYLEYASGRLGGSPQNQTTLLQDVTDKEVVISIKNTPGLSRAFHDLEITPKRARALTIPIHRISYNKRVDELESSGHKVFRPKGTNILAESRGTGRRAKIRPLYALVRKARVPKDEGLLPTENDLRKWATDAAEVFFEALG